MPAPHLLRTLSIALALSCVLPVHAWALDPSRSISQYAHAAWRARDGFFRGSPYTFVQTADGYLWVGTDSGLLRFDGVRFVPWTAGEDVELPTAEVMQLLAARDGSLWVATLGGMSRVKGNHVTNHATGSGGVARMLEDRHGTLWFGRRFPDSAGTVLCQWKEPEPRCLGTADGMPPLGALQAMLEDRRGTVWIGGDTALVRWSNNSFTAYRPAGLENNGGIGGITALAEGSDGTLWVGTAKAGPDLGLQRMVDGRLEAVRTSLLDFSSIAISALYVDRDDSLWVGTTDRGLYRIRGDAVDHFGYADGLSSDFVADVTGDREGNIWVATPEGVDRLSESAVVSVSTREGLCSPEAASVLATRDGSVWSGGDGGLTRIRDGRISCLRSGRELPGAQVTSLFEDSGGRLWVGLDDGIGVYDRSRVTMVRRSDGRPIGLVTSIAETTDGRIWLVANGPPRVVLQVDGTTARQVLPNVAMPRRVAADGDGGLWLGLVAGDLVHARDGHLQTFSFGRTDTAFLNQLVPRPGGSVLAATNFGVAAVVGGRPVTMTSRNGLPCDAVNTMVFDATGDLWLFTSCGLTRIARADLERWLQDPATQVSPLTLDELDGLRIGRAAFESSAQATDGRLWFANGSMLQVIDPARRRRNTLPPPVHIEQVVANRTRHLADGLLRLPPVTRDLQIDYVALSFVAPQKVRFRYRLEGRDTDWQEPGTRRQAFYSDLPPGGYRFRVIASNNDGVWNEEGAVLDLVIAPAWYQATWFHALAAFTGLAIIWGGYQFRVRQVARMLTARFDERLAERSRMARDLHDTLLQTVQGSKMVADTALDRTDDPAGMRSAMERVSAWLGQASREGRAAVLALRTSTTERNDLAEAFRRAIDECRDRESMQAELTVTGAVREMHPVVRDEVYRIGYEAIRNACTHSGGRRVMVTLAYGRDLTLRIVDDGAGMDAAVAATGIAGHFGLQGMRERADRIGATLTIDSGAGDGTRVTLLVPGRAIFSQPPSLLDRIGRQ